MTNTQYQLNSSLPFDVSEDDPTVQRMLSAAPKHIWTRINNADGHDEETLAYDHLGDWVALNWREFFPPSAR